jgi:hypothetical protein
MKVELDVKGRKQLPLNPLGNESRPSLQISDRREIKQSDRSSTKLAIAVRKKAGDREKVEISDLSENKIGDYY